MLKRDRYTGVVKNCTVKELLTILIKFRELEKNLQSIAIALKLMIA